MGVDSLMRQEVRELSACLNEMRLSLGRLWEEIDSLKAQLQDVRTDWLPGVDARVVALESDDTVTVTSQPMFVDDDRLEVVYD